MNAAAKVILDRLGTLPWPVDDTNAAFNKAPRVLVVPPAGAPSLEQALDGARGNLDGDLLVKAIGANAESARGVLARTRTVLTRDGRPWSFTTDTHRVTLTWEDTPQDGVVDRDVTFTGTNTNPVFYTDQYRLTATPL